MKTRRIQDEGRERRVCSVLDSYTKFSAAGAQSVYVWKERDFPESQEKASDLTLCTDSHCRV